MRFEDVRRELPGGGVVEGRVDSRFRDVAKEFVQNFIDRGELGASAHVTVKGETVVDLWGGHADDAKKNPWKENTVSIIFSSTKGATAICAHMLASRGALKLDAPVAEYWPEFAKKGKEQTLVRMMLDHSVGVPALRAPLKDGGFADWDYMCRALEEEEPFWEPGTANGYHGLTFAWTVGQLVRRAAKKSLGQFFADEIAGPLGLEFWIGLPEAIEPRVANMIWYTPQPTDPVSDFTKALMSDPKSNAALFLLNSGGFNQGVNTRLGHSAEVGSANGITNARGLAGMYAPLANGGVLKKTRLVDETTLARMSEVSATNYRDRVLMCPTRFGLGFMKSMDNRYRPLGHLESVILGSRAFGHVGAGGSIGFADPDCEMSFGYTMNRMGNGLFLNPRGQSLVDATYKALGYRSNASGTWQR
jgi:CubicO group peptidase (beta-lactamase class C family)